MANKLIKEMGLPLPIANIFAARNITTAKDALSMTDFELMELLDVGLTEVTSAVAHISKLVSPPYQTVQSLMKQRVRNEYLSGYLPTRLKGLDEALCGGIPFGVLTELVGPAGIGKTQEILIHGRGRALVEASWVGVSELADNHHFFTIKDDRTGGRGRDVTGLARITMACERASCGGLDGHVVYIDVESKFSSRRIIEIGAKSFPEIFHMKGMAQKMAGRILVLQPTSLSEFTESLQQIKVSLLQHEVKLLVIDSMTALVSGDNDLGVTRQQSLGWHISFIKSLAEFSRIPVVVTNQVRSQSFDEKCQYSFQAKSRGEPVDDSTRYDSHLVAALGIHWAHAVTIRLVLESKLGQRFLKVAKSPISAPLAFPFNITSSGISLLNDDGIEVVGSEINTIHCQGQSDIINFTGERLQ